MLTCRVFVKQKQISTLYKRRYTFIKLVVEKFIKAISNINLNVKISIFSICPKSIRLLLIK